MISFDDFKKIEICAGKILAVEKVPNADKLLKLTVDFNEKTEVVAAIAPSVDIELSPDTQPVKTIIPKFRQIISGISAFFPDPQVLVGKTSMFVTNLEPRIIRGLESQGMILAISTPPTESNPLGNFSLLEPNQSIPPGTCAK